MTDLNRSLPCRESELNKALESLHFAFRRVIARPDAILLEHGLSRLHHRILYFVGRNRGLSISDLLAILNITKQSLNAPLRQLLQRDFIVFVPDETDRRIKRLVLTHSGAILENEISGDQRARFEKVFQQVGPECELAWRKVMGLLAEF